MNVVISTQKLQEQNIEWSLLFKVMEQSSKEMIWAETWIT